MAREARMRAVTIALLVAMLAVSGVAFSGTTKPNHGQAGRDSTRSVGRPASESTT